MSTGIGFNGIDNWTLSEMVNKKFELPLRNEIHRKDLVSDFDHRQKGR